MDLEQCKSGLTNEITGCDQGGRSKYTNWEYTSVHLRESAVGMWADDVE